MIKHYKKYLPYSRQLIDDSDIKAVTEVLKSDWLTTGPKIKEFEGAVAKYCNAKYAVAVSSGTAALHLASTITCVQKKNKIITSPITFVSSANCSYFNNGNVDFADIYPDTYNINVEKIIDKVDSDTTTIIPVDFAGQPCRLYEINKVAKENDLHVIEDASHAIGSEYKGRKIGSISELTIFSFHPVKLITTGEGGMILTNNKEYYEQLLMLRTNGVTKDKTKMKKYHGDWYYEMQQLGYNYKLTDYQCSLGISQLKKLDSFIKRRREIAKTYNEAFESIPEIITPYEKPDVKSAYHLYVIQVNNRKHVFAELRKRNIGVQVHYIPVYKQPFYQNQGHKENEYSIAENYYKHCMSIPMFPKMTDDDVNTVIQKIKQVIL